MLTVSAFCAAPEAAPPLAALLSWPAERPLCALVGEGWRLGGAGAVSVLGEPVEERWFGPHETEALLAELDNPPKPGQARAGALFYELGQALEPTAHGPAGPNTREPLGFVCTLTQPLVYDHRQGRWRQGPQGLMADRGAEKETLEEGRWRLGPMRSVAGRLRHEAAAQRVVELIRAGDVFQANLSHALSGRFTGDGRALAASLLGLRRPALGAYIESAAQPGTALLSLSPELLWRLDGPSRRVLTSPIKGTSRSRQALLRSAKDAAELTMIVDLMRNDLGRVCRVGSVRVQRARRLFRAGGEGGVWHSCADVTGRLAPAKGVAELVRASFPAGSITGAPKVRAMQIIDELEGAPRGVFFGSIVLLDAQGGGVCSVAIRTIRLEGAAPRHGWFDQARATLRVGGGVVADSTPHSEWLETLAKARATLPGDCAILDEPTTTAAAEARS